MRSIWPLCRGFGAAHNTGVAVHGPAYAQPIHYKPGEADQILVDKGGDWTVLDWTGSGFSATDTGVAASRPIDADDIDGDGYDDLLTVSGGNLRARLNRAASGTDGFKSAQTVYSFPAGSYDGAIGFRGIGAAAARGPNRTEHLGRGTEAGVVVRVRHHEKICLTDGCRHSTYITRYRDRAFAWTGGALTPFGAAFARSRSNSGGGQVIALDANGDGLTDLVLSGTAKLLLDTGGGFSSVAYGSSTSGLELGRAVAADYTGNGRDDLLVPSTSTGHWMRLASTGAGFAAAEDTGLPSGVFGAHPAVVDSAGRMLSDLIGANGSGDLELSLRRGPYPDRLARVTDGFGNYHALTWTRLANTGDVKATWSTNRRFELARRGPYVMVTDRQNDGVGGSYTKSYVYDTAVRQAGAGFAGVYRFTATDSRTGRTTERRFLVNRFAEGIPSRVIIRQANGDKIRDDFYLYYNNVFPGPGAPLQLRRLASTRYDKHGNPLVRVAHDYQYGPYYVVDDAKTVTTNLKTNARWVKETQRTNVQSETTTDWCVGLMSDKTVIDTLPDGQSARRKTTYAPNLSKCRYRRKVTGANLAGHLQTTTRYSYDNFGNPAAVSVTGHKPNGQQMTTRTTQYAYDNRGEFRVRTTDAVGDVTRVAWNGAYGAKSSVTAPNGAVTHYAYDGFGRRVKTTLPSGAYSTVTYKRWSCSWTSYCAYYLYLRRYTAGGSAVGKAVRKYDRYGRQHVFSTVRTDGPSWAHMVKRYNALGELTQKSAPFYNGGTRHWTDYSYDPLGRVTSIKVPVAGSRMATTRYAYNGLNVTVTEPGGATKAVTKDAIGHTVSVAETPSGGVSHTSHYVYAPFDELKRLTGPDGRRTTLAYDPAGHRTQLKGPDRRKLGFAADSLGEVVSETNANGQHITVAYDRVGRVTQRSFPNPAGGTETQSWHYATSGHAAGRLVSERDPAIDFTRSLAYNAYGLPTRVTQSLGGRSLQLDFGFDSLGRMSSVTYPVNVGGHKLKVNYTYDGNGQLAKVANANNGTVYWQPQTGAGFPAQNARGQWEAYTLGGGLDVERLHDPATGAVTSITSGPNGSGKVLNVQYGYNTSLSLTSLKDLNESLREQFDYTGLQQLKTVSRSTASGNSSSGFSYGAAGRFKRGPAGSYSYGSVPTHSPSSTGRYGGYGYNAAGDRKTGEGRSITWDALGKARHISAYGHSFGLTYGPDGGLVDNTGPDGGRYLGAWLKKTDGSHWSARIRVNGRVVAVVKNAGGRVSTHYLLRNHLGSTAAVASGGGTLQRRISYGAWGNFVNPATGRGTVASGTVGSYTTVTYTGHELIAGADLINMGARLYDPKSGLFMSPDPTVARPYDPMDLNQYAYVGNSPMTFSDPYGYFKVGPFLLGITEGAGALVSYGLLGAGEAASDGLSTPIEWAGFGMATSMAVGAEKNLKAAFQNKPQQETPLGALVGDSNSTALEGSLTLMEMAAEPAKGVGIAGRYLAVNGALAAAHIMADSGGLLGNGIPEGSNFATYHSDGSLQFSGLYTSKSQVGGVYTINTQMGWVVECGASGCNATGFMPGTGKLVSSSGHGSIKTIGYYPGGGVVVGLPGGGTVIVEDGGALGTIVWGTEASVRSN